MNSWMEWAKTHRALIVISVILGLAIYYTYFPEGITGPAHLTILAAIVLSIAIAIIVIRLIWATIQRLERAPAKAPITSSGGTALTASVVSMVSFASSPLGAEIEVDGVFVGSTPADLPLTVEQHKITISRKGFKTYERVIHVLSGSAQRISVELESE